ncbi:uncharacterized protein LOC132751549 [Ruditapes philippinarum]|uniref:uncharacterized protein LOC132751549 n=1 Tax=Ruditapes philippinarum TaxID=129788 RepID=UPI00295AFC18|nr:uncharacterized protein LOC132751549 [Ruditapes philippinarum]
MAQECKGCSADFDDIPRARNGSVYYARNSTHHIMKFANAQFNNKGCNESELVFHNSNVTNYQQCAGACADNSSCFSYFYHPDKQECLGCQSEYSVLRTSPVLEEWAGSMYYGRFRYLGCYVNLPLILENAHTHFPGMVTESCVEHCISGGYLYAVTESGSWCQCGNVFSPNTTLTDDLCNWTCVGNVDQFCGATNVGSVYIIHYW